MSKMPENIGMNMALVAGFLSLKTISPRFTLSMLPFCFPLNSHLVPSSITLSPRDALVNWSGHNDGLPRQNRSYRFGLGFHGLGFHSVYILKGFTMIAFYTDGKILVKAYSHNTDWQLFSDKKERWFSTWSHDKRASLHRAFVSFLGHDIDPNQIHGLKDVRG